LDADGRSRDPRARNTVTGQRFEILYGTGGRRLIPAVDGKTPPSHVMGDLMFDSETEYKIRDGHIITYIGARRSR